jgi:hypothetical protein
MGGEFAGIRGTMSSFRREGTSALVRSAQAGMESAWALSLYRSLAADSQEIGEF